MVKTVKEEYHVAGIKVTKYDDGSYSIIGFINGNLIDLEDINHDLTNKDLL